MQLKLYANQHLRTILFSLVSLTLIATAFLCPQQLHAEGSKELSARGGYRAYMYARLSFYNQKKETGYLLSTLFLTFTLR